ncbi:MAG: CRISPR-associated helicase Cas3' [Ignavibacteriales bacterium]|nr:MAG: CRISPR-associated helicase Cas3' [Ignavibacteriales bacterium]
MYLAKPTGITLKEHTAHVMEEAEYILSACPFYEEKYFAFTGVPLREMLFNAVKYHDAGKMHDKWQKACQQDYLLFKQSGVDKAVNLMKANLRHEFASIDYCRIKNISLSDEVTVAIAAHHRKLSRYYQSRLEREGWTDIFNQILRLNNRELSRNDNIFNDIIKKKFRFSAVRALLQLADHRASAKEGGINVLPLTKFSYKFPHPEMNQVQKLALEGASQLLTLLRAPTGAGKTDAAFLWGSKLIENKLADRVVIALPTRFTANSMAVGAAEKLSSTGLYHSTSDMFLNDKNLRSLSRLLMTPVTITTIDHLLIALTGTEEDHHTIFYNLANAALVIDEADFYDSFTQANILTLLQALSVLKVPVLVMSATLPEVSQKFYQVEGNQLPQILNDSFDESRIKCTISKIEEEEAITYALNQIKSSGKKIIFFANTIDRALNYYKAIEEQGFNAILYHSRFTEPDKKEKESLLLNAFGPESKADAVRIAILTQIGEMSVNISSDIMFSDICPGDRMVQRIGRLKRFSKEPGELFYIEPKDKNGEFYPAPYGEFNRASKAWIPALALQKTLTLIEQRSYTFKQLLELVNRIYSELPDCDATALANKNLYYSLICNNNIVLPAADADEDNATAGDWKSRQGIDQVKVFINLNGQFEFANRYDFYQFEFENTVQIPIYLKHKLIKDNLLGKEKVIIRSDEQEINILTARFQDYSFEKGFMPSADNDTFL